MKKSYSLALWWWAAKWLCHIWVLKYLEENNFKINEVSWTSMGAIIWACIAIGKTSDEIKKIAEGISIFKLTDISFWKWIISGNKIYKFLEDLFWDTKIEDTKIPLIIIATNLNTWEKIVLKKWKIDGWKEILKDTSFLNLKFKKWFFWYNIEVMKKLVLISMSTNEDLTIEIAKNSWKNIILLVPNLWEFEFQDFNKVDELYKKWYEEAKIKLSNINQQCIIKEFIKKYFK